MEVESQSDQRLDYSTFRRRVDAEAFTLKLRLELLESFMDRPSNIKDEQQAPNSPDIKTKRQLKNAVFPRGSDNFWEFQRGTLTIVDLSCPFIDESSACALFSICLDLFLESRDNSSRIVALDEAHKV